MNKSRNKIAKQAANKLRTAAKKAQFSNQYRCQARNNIKLLMNHYAANTQVI